MKKYLWPIALSILINIMLIIVIFYNHLQHKALQQKKPTIVTVKLKQTLAPHASHEASSSEATDNAQQWLSQHYGKLVTVNQHFKAGQHLQGYVVNLKSNPHSHSIIYAVNGGEYYVIGTILDKHGKDISLINTHHYISNPLNKTIYNAAQHLKGIKEGKPSAPVVTVIIDPNSNLFTEQWKELQYDIKQGIFSVNWVLVNYLKPMGPDVASHILQANDKIAAMKFSALNYNVDTQTGGYQGQLSTTKQSAGILRHHWDFIEKYGLYKLPITILKNKQHYYVLQGAVIDETLEAIFSNED